MMAPVSMFCQNTLTVHQKNGEQFSFGFEEKPIVSFTDNELVIKSTGAEVRYQLEMVAKFTFDEKETAVNDIKPDSGKAIITLDEYTVRISGAKPESSVSITASDGKQLQSYKISNDGSVTFSIADFSDDIYIINTESLTVKIIKK